MDRFETEKATPYFEKVLELDPNNEKGNNVESTYRVALFEARTNQNVEPLIAFIATNPEEEYLLISHSSLASTYAIKEDTENTIATYEGAILKFPDNLSLKKNYASNINALEIESKYDKGVELLENALAADPDDVFTNYDLGLLYHKRGELEKAIAVIRIVTEKYPNQKDIAAVLAKMEKELEESK